MSVASVAQLLQEQGGSGGGSVNDVIGGTGITVTADSFGDYTVDNDGVLELTAGTNITISGTKDNYTINSTGGGGGAVSSIIAGTGITIAPTTGVGDVTITNDAVLALQGGSGITITGTNAQLTITSDVNPVDYYTSAQADGLFQTLTGMGLYSTTAEADALYLTPATAGGLYQTLVGMNDYSTTAEADALYAPINSGVTSIVAGTGITISPSTGLGDVTVTSDMVASDYSTTAVANTLYQPAGNAFLTEATANTLYAPIGRYYIAQLNYALTNVAPNTGIGGLITVPFYSNAGTSAVFITVNEGANIATILPKAYISGTPVFNPPSTQLNLEFFNTSPSVTVNTGISYSILIFNTQ